MREATTDLPRPRSGLVLIALGLSLSISLSGALATESAAETLAIPRTASEITIDGVLDEPAWDEALVVTLDYETQPGENVAARVRTEALVTHDQTALYVAFRCHDPEPDKIRSRFSARDLLWNDDNVGVVLDTFNDQRRSFDLATNPAGVQFDAINDEVGANYDTDWDAIWSSKARVTPAGWEAEMAIPFHQLRFQTTAEPQVWGFTAFRSYPREDTHLFEAAPIERGNNSYLSQLLKLRGFEGIERGRDLELVPTLTAARTDSRRDSTGGFETVAEQAEAGVTATWGLTPNWTLSGTLNPDFSQVEADVVKLDVNQTFALFFPETRPFFLEGADTFNTAIPLVHTRTVADPSGAVKVSGKQDRHLTSLFSARDEITNILIPGPEGSTSGSFDLASTTTVARYRYDLEGSSTIGALVTDRRGGGYANRVLALDATLRFSTRDSLEIQAARSRTAYSSDMRERLDLDSRQLDDQALLLRYRHSRRSWNTSSSYTDFGEGFRTDVGFLPLVDQRRWQVGGNRIWFPKEGRFVNRIGVGSEAFAGETRSGDLLSSGYSLHGFLAGGRDLFVNAVANRGTKRFRGVDFDLENVFVNGGIRPTSRIHLTLRANTGDTIDVVHTRPADSFQVGPSIRLNLGRHLEVDFRWELTGLDVAGGRLFETRVSELRTIYHFNQRAFVRAVVQHIDIQREQRLYTPAVDARTRDLLTQLLFSYELDPRTALFVGYSDTSRADDELASLVRNERTLFIKLGYAWLR